MEDTVRSGDESDAPVVRSGNWVYVGPDEHRVRKLKDAVEASLKTPFFLSFPVMIMGGLLVILVILILGVRAIRTQDLDAKIDKAIKVQGQMHDQIKQMQMQEEARP